MPDDTEYTSGEEEEIFIEGPPSPDDQSARRPTQRPPRPKTFHCTYCERSFDRPSLLGQVRSIAFTFTGGIHSHY